MSKIILSLIISLLFSTSIFANENFNSYLAKEEVYFEMPQNLLFFANLVEDKDLLTAEELAKEDKRYNDFFFGPWDKSKPYYSKKEFADLVVNKAKGYNYSEAWNKETWQELNKNRNIENYPSIKSQAIVINGTNLRSVPTAKPQYGEPTDTPNLEYFDFFQYHYLALGTPVFVSNLSLDQEWYFVEHPLVSGWVQAKDIALVNKDFTKKYKNNHYAVIIKEKVSLKTKANQEIAKVNIGSLFPYISETAESLTILVPVLENKELKTQEVELAKEFIAIKPIMPSPKKIATIGNEMLGQSYAWGGLNGERDCSILTRDLFTPFGIWLHKNSKAQVEIGTFTKIESLSEKDKKAKLSKSAKPFFSLISLPGHVALYLGSYNDEAVIFHSILGLRTTDPEEIYRHIIGKTVITGMEAGKNKPEIQLWETLLERARAFKNLP